METNGKKSLLGIIAAVPFGIIALRQLWYSIAALSRGTISAWVLLWLLVDLAMTVFLALRMRNAVLPAVAGGWALLEVRSFFLNGMTTGGVDFDSLFGALALIALCVIMALNLTEKGRILWFIPGIIAAIYVIGMWIPGFGQIGFLLSWYPEGVPHALWYYIFYPILFAAGMWLAGRWFAYPNGAPMKIAAGQPSGGTPSGSGYRDMLPHILLLLFTCGIYYLYWIYWATDYLNRVEDEAPRNPVTKLLLCWFIPFYSIYWVYKSAQRVDRLARSKGIPSDLSTICTVLAVFVGIIPPMLMQDKINAIALAENGAGPYQPPIPPYQPAPPQQPAGMGAAEELKAYKDLLDQGAITQEEYDAKKKQLLNL